MGTEYIHPHGPMKDTNERFTAYMLGQQDYIAGEMCDPEQHGIYDAYRHDMYVVGYTNENLDHMDVVPATQRR